MLKERGGIEVCLYREYEPMQNGINCCMYIPCELAVLNTVLHPFTKFAIK